MKRLTQIVLVLLLLAPIPLCAEPPQPTLSPAELSTVKRFCVRLIGVSHDRWFRLWPELRPFVKDLTEFETRVPICSAGCQGGVTLRGGYGVVVYSPNVADGTAKYRRQVNVVDLVILSKDNRPIFTVSRNENDPSSVYVATSRRELLSRLSSHP